MNLEQAHGYGGGKYDVNSKIPFANLTIPDKKITFDIDSTVPVSLPLGAVNGSLSTMIELPNNNIIYVDYNTTSTIYKAHMNEITGAFTNIFTISIVGVMLIQNDDNYIYALSFNSTNTKISVYDLTTGIFVRDIVIGVAMSRNGSSFTLHDNYLYVSLGVSLKTYKFDLNGNIVWEFVITIAQASIPILNNKMYHIKTLRSISEIDIFTGLEIRTLPIPGDYDIGLLNSGQFISAIYVSTLADIYLVNLNDGTFASIYTDYSRPARHIKQNKSGEVFFTTSLEVLFSYNGGSQIFAFNPDTNTVYTDWTIGYFYILFNDVYCVATRTNTRKFCKLHEILTIKDFRKTNVIVNS